MTTFDDAKKDIAGLVAKRLGLDAAGAASMSEQFLLAVVDQAVTNLKGQTMGPTSIAVERVQLVEILAARLGRLPSARELAALLRITESTARAALRNVLAVSDRAHDLALKSVFGRATAAGAVGKDGHPSNGKRWQFTSRDDLHLARELLESRSIAFSTQEDVDGNYMLVVDRNFDPAKL